MEKDIDLVCAQTGVTREKAEQVLKDMDGDIVAAILKLQGFDVPTVIEPVCRGAFAPFQQNITPKEFKETMQEPSRVHILRDPKFKPGDTVSCKTTGNRYKVVSYNLLALGDSFSLTWFYGAEAMDFADVPSLGGVDGFMEDELRGPIVDTTIASNALMQKRTTLAPE